MSVMAPISDLTPTSTDVGEVPTPDIARTPETDIYLPTRGGRETWFRESSDGSDLSR